MPEEPAAPLNPTSPNQILQRLLERLYGSLVGGPSLNCRPHTSRQRMDLAAFTRFADLPPAAIIPALLASTRKVEVMAKTPYRGPSDEDAPLSDEQLTAKRASDEQTRLLSKLRDIAEDARDYEQDHGESALYVGYPVLHLPPGAPSFGGSRRSTGARAPRILAPVALIPVEMVVRRGPGTPSVTFKARGSGTDLVVPNFSLLAWIEQQTGQDANNLFADEGGEEPWREINEIVRFVAESLRLPIPTMFDADSLVLPSPRGGGDKRGLASTGDDDDEARDPAETVEPSFLSSAVLGLFPITNQGLLRDMKAMAAAPTPTEGPVASFLSVDLNAGLSADAGSAPGTEAAPPTRQVIDPRQQRLVASADPCQVRAVRLARECPALVVHGPPGTGKSQTITNMIGDHLSRGERVLLVCDKRTALDVVRYRLDALGLGGLCAVVHDPQRDQRTLYKALRDRLEGLAESRPPTAAVEGDLDALDADLVRLHAEVGTYHHALQEAPAEGVPSFQELVGQWLSIPDPTHDLGLDVSGVGALTLEELQSGHADVSELLERARKIRYAENLWVEAVGLSLAEYLSRPVAQWRETLAKLARAAERVDTDTPGGGLPPLDADAVAPLPIQAERREHLAAKLSTFSAVPGGAQAVTFWLANTPEQITRALQEFAGMQADMAWATGTPLEPALLAAHPSTGGGGAAVADLNRAVGTLQAYESAAARWFGGFVNPQKQAAQTLVAPYGLTLDPAASTRLRTFLQGVAARAVLQDFLNRVIKANLGADSRSGVADDDTLSRTFVAHRSALELLTFIHGDATFTSLSATLWQNLPDPEHTRTFGGLLKRSAQRARALAGFTEQSRQAAVFSANWLNAQDGAWRAGESLIATFTSLEELAPTLEDLLRVSQTYGRLPANLQGPVGGLIWRQADPAQSLHDLRRNVLARDIGTRLAGSTALQDVDGDRVNALFARYAHLSKTKRDLVRDLILARWHKRQRDRLLSTTRTQLNNLGAALKRRLITRGERAVKLRQVIAQGAATPGGDPLFDLCPVWIASPGTVAQIFPREPLFDCVIFDEASQCRLEEALPVLLRAKRVVVAGDPKQLPPTRFFESALAESENVDAETDQELFEQQQGETEDLLAAALNIQVQQSYLDVHYRSRSEALIGFSNENFYDRRLQAIPGHPKNRAKASPVRLMRVDGVYEKRTNRQEAEAVVTLVKELLAQAEPPSVGVACFNLTQRELVLDLLEEAALADREFAARLATARTRQGSGSFEGLFVKNLENVQGDERDHIIVSTTFGPDPAGKFRRNFGPLGRAGGGRRLNVLVTRARDMVHVLTSIPRGEYVALPSLPPGEQPGGRWLLYAYLRYAEELATLFEKDQERLALLADTRQEGEVRVRPSETGSVLVQALATRLAEEGHSSDVYWGNEGFGIDLALRHPLEAEMVTAGVLCDMTRFTQVEDPVEWELFRTAVHLSQGWHLHRIWSPAVFRDLERVQQEIGAAAKAAQEVEDNKARVGPPVAER